MPEGVYAAADHRKLLKNRLQHIELRRFARKSDENNGSSNSAGFRGEEQPRLGTGYFDNGIESFSVRECLDTRASLFIRRIDDLESERLDLIDPNRIDFREDDPCPSLPSDESNDKTD